jgi:hypothetical protein
MRSRIIFSATFERWGLTMMGLMSSIVPVEEPFTFERRINLPDLQMFGTRWLFMAARVS